MEFVSRCCHVPIGNSFLAEGLEICNKCGCTCESFQISDYLICDENALQYWNLLPKEDRDRLAKKVARHPENPSIFDIKMALHELYSEGQLDSFLNVED